MIRSLTRTAGPAIDLPVLVDDLRRHLRLDASDEDFLLETWLRAAVDNVEGYTGAVLSTSTFEARLDSFPGAAEIELPRNPVQSITSVQYVDAAGSTQTMAGADYQLVAPADPIGGIATLALGYGKSWPSARGGIGDVRITFVAGYADRKSIPQEIVSAVLLIGADLFENREGQGREASFVQNPTLRALLAPHRRRWF